MESFALPSADVVLEDAVFRSGRFSDSYSQREDPLGESAHVFLAGNGLPERWHGVDSFHIGELGFGVGRNFLLSWDLFRRTAAPTSRLHYISFEAYPLTPEELERFWIGFPALLPLARELIAALPRRIAGFHRLMLDGGRLSLTLIYGDARTTLPQLVGQLDAWFLDGFAPSKNPELWSPTVLREVARCSKPGATATTYSVSASLRRSLQALDCEVEQIPGYRRKRAMLKVRFARGSQSAAPIALGERTPRRVIVVGGGLAGSCAALSFARRGCAVTLLEQSDAIATGASGNAAGVFMPHLAAKPDLMTRFYLAGYHHLLRELESLKQAGAGLKFSADGVVRLATSARLQNLLGALAGLGLDPAVARTVLPAEASALVGSEVKEAGIFFSEGGWLSPPALAKANLECVARLVTLKLHTHVDRLTYRNGEWVAFAADGSLLDAAPIAVIANGYEALDIEELRWLPVEKVRGQILHLPASSLTKQLRLPVCYDGYVTPQAEGFHFVGATYSHDDDEPGERVEEQSELLRRLQASLPAFPGALEELSEEARTLAGRVAFRTMSRDRLPIAGPVPDRERFAEAYRAGGMREIPLEALRAQADRARDGFGLNVPGLYVSVGHGSRGLISCHLSAELIASHVFAETLPLPRDVVSSIFPVRYCARELKRS